MFIVNRIVIYLRNEWQLLNFSFGMDRAVFAKITVYIKIIGIIAEICAYTWEPSDHSLMVYIKHETVPSAVTYHLHFVLRSHTELNDAI